MNFHEVLSYDPETGVFRWKIRAARNVQIGDIAGHVDEVGYHIIKVLNKQYKAHRLAWFMHHGAWPGRQLDHINEDKADNRLVNLRLATNRQNQCNRGKNKNNTSGFKGVHWHKEKKRWVAKIRFCGHLKHLGYFDSPEEAYSAYCAAATHYHGEFANVGAVL